MKILSLLFYLQQMGNNYSQEFAYLIKNNQFCANQYLYRKISQRRKLHTHITTI